MAIRAQLPLVLACAVAAAAQDPRPVGYTDTPVLPGSPWRVHDGRRPAPDVVEPGGAGPGAAPADAVVLFDGTDLSAWRGRDGEAKWAVADGVMTVNGTGDIRTVQEFGDLQLHIEWATPSVVAGDGQGRGNSGVFLMGRYEVQILDSFGNATYPDGQAAALYGQTPPLVNASRGPGEWQVYDIVFRAPRFAGGELREPGYVTVLHNGVVVHHHRALLGPTSHRSLPRYTPHAPRGPIRLQDHGNPMRFRNIWVRELRPYPGEFAIVREAGNEGLTEAMAALTGRPLIAWFWRDTATLTDGAVAAFAAARDHDVEIIAVALDSTVPEADLAGVRQSVPRHLAVHRVDFPVYLYTGADPNPASGVAEVPDAVVAPEHMIVALDADHRMVGAYTTAPTPELIEKFVDLVRTDRRGPDARKHP